MLRSLAIRDIVVFDQLDLTLANGLCALTGETGAGKSILLDSLGLALGARAEGRLVRTGAERGGVTATFDLPPRHPVRDLLVENELPGSDEIILRRSVALDGRSRAWINDQPVSIGLLSSVGAHLVEIHGQAAEVGLLDAASHRPILDAFASLERDVAALHKQWDAWQETARKLDGARAALAQARADEELLRHTVDELSDLAPEEGEADQLSERRGFMMQVEKIADAVNDATAALEKDGGVATKLRTAERALDRVREQAGDRLGPAMDALARAGVELDEAINAIMGVSADLDADPDDVDAVEERLFALRAAGRKHQIDPDRLPDLLQQKLAELRSIEKGDQDLAALEAEAEALSGIWRTAAETLSAKRQAAATLLNEAVEAELQPLRMGGARFITDVVPQPPANWGPEGLDRVAFMVATNPGARPGPIAKIASGGELSRFMLALKVVLAATGDAPTMIFDEVDRGVGGATADAVGERLARLAETFQVLVVTHSPQVAARADRQWLIAKQVGETAITRVDPLDGDARREEIARMLSGAEVTAEARAAADRLLEEPTR
ncbi:MAG: DNA repair protein RecN [Minwuia sp.]|nr:DNA repair protein RecN [Minwuia sp.]